MTLASTLLSAEGLRRWFFVAVVLTLAFRVWLAAVTPITGDEAYFVIWGRIPDWGFYDHPPMVGWWLALLLKFSEATWWLRLPSVIQPAILSLVIAWVFRGEGSVGWVAALLLLLSPGGVWNVLISTDTPLIYFSVLSGLAFVRAVRDDSPRFYLLAGVLLGGALLSKYFGVLLGLAYVAYALLRPTRGRLLGLLLVAMAATPFVALNLWWNWDHCWANLMFNLYNRHGDAGLSWRTPPLYALSLLYLLSPPVLLLLPRQRARLAQRGRAPEMQALLLVALAPLAIFALLSLAKTIGLHWLLSFVPFVFILAARTAAAEQLAGLVRFMIGYAMFHVVAAFVIYNLPLEVARTTRFYDGLVMTVKSQEVLAFLEPYARDYHFATEGYSPSVTMSFNAKRYFLVFGEASSHARHDDILTDFRSLQGENILVLRKSPPTPAEYDPYFREVEYRNFEVRGASYHLVLGRGFDYPAYRETVLAKVRERYYAIPRYLPQGPCYFCERYFPGMVCRRQ